MKKLQIHAVILTGILTGFLKLVPKRETWRVVIHLKMRVAETRAFASPHLRDMGGIGMSGEAHSTTDHELIRKWAEQRNGQPAAVQDTGSANDPGVLRIQFPDYGKDENLTKISWEDFFRKFEQERLAFVYPCLRLPGHHEGRGDQPILQVRIPGFRALTLTRFWSQV